MHCQKIRIMWLGTAYILLSKVSLSEFRQNSTSVNQQTWKEMAIWGRFKIEVHTEISFSRMNMVDVIPRRFLNTIGHKARVDRVQC